MPSQVNIETAAKVDCAAVEHVLASVAAEDSNSEKMNTLVPAIEAMTIAGAMNLPAVESDSGCNEGVDTIYPPPPEFQDDI